MVGAGSTVPVSVSHGLESASAGDVPTQHPTAAVLRLEEKATTNDSGNGNPNNNTNSPAMRIPARVPPPQPEPVVVVRPTIPNTNATIPEHHHNHGHNHNIPPPVAEAAIPLVPPSSTGDVFVSSHALAAREQSFRVRTALTKGWRKGKKTRKSVGGGRGPGFTNREVDGLLELLEDAVPVTREEWEQVRARHALRFPGTSRSIDSIRRKFAKVYLARGPAGMVDGHTAPVMRRAKLIRERMAARAVSLDDEDASMGDPSATGNNADGATAVGHVEAMDTTGIHEDADGEEHHHIPENEGAAITTTNSTQNVSEQVLEGGVQVPVAVQVPVSSGVGSASGLAPVSLSMVVNDLGGTTHANGTDTGAPIAAEAPVAEEAAAEITTSPVRSPPRKKQNTSVEGSEDLLSVFKMYMAQEAQSREEERRIRAEEREQAKITEKAREEREVRRHDQFMQILMLLAQNKQPRDS